MLEKKRRDFRSKIVAIQVKYKRPNLLTQSREVDKVFTD
jgi:hypothetical protein